MLILYYHTTILPYYHSIILYYHSIILLYYTTILYYPYYHTILSLYHTTILPISLYHTILYILSLYSITLSLYSITLPYHSSLFPSTPHTSLFVPLNTILDQLIRIFLFKHFIVTFTTTSSVLACKLQTTRTLNVLCSISERMFRGAGRTWMKMRAEWPGESEKERNN